MSSKSVVGQVGMRVVVQVGKSGHGLVAMWIGSSVR